MPDLWAVEKSKNVDNVSVGAKIALDIADGVLRVMDAGAEVLREPVAHVVFERYGKMDGVLHVNGGELAITYLGEGTAGDLQAALWDAKRPGAEVAARMVDPSDVRVGQRAKVVYRVASPFTGTRGQVTEVTENQIVIRSDKSGASVAVPLTNVASVEALPEDRTLEVAHGSGVATAVSGATFSSRSEGSWTSPGYRSARTRAKWTQAFFGLSALVGVWSLGLSISGLDLAGRGLAATVQDWSLFVSSANTLSGAESLSVIALAVAFLAWLSRTVEIIPTIGGGTPKDSPRWSIGWWFVPIAFLWKPYTVVQDAWGRLATDTRNTDSKLVGAWWAAWIGGAIVIRASGVLASSARDFEDLKAGFFLTLVGSALLAGAAVLGFLVVREIQARADERAMALGLDPEAGTLQPATSQTEEPQLRIVKQGTEATPSRPVAELAAVAQRTTHGADEHETQDGIELIRRLAQLRNDGLLTVEQFDAKKLEIIGRL